MTVTVREPGTGWWRRNLVWLVVLPLAVALAVAAWSFRFVSFYRYDVLVQEIDAVPAGGTAHYSGEYFDLGLDAPERANTWVERELDVRVLGVERAEKLPDSLTGTLTAVPEGAEAWRVDLELAAEPGTDLGLCEVILVSSDGTRYESAATGDPLGQNAPCTPDTPEESFDSVAPRPSPSSSASHGPSTWEASTVLLTRAGETWDRVLVSFGPPEYVTIELPR
ncbi:hypothetical protein GCM10028784_11700 [Myceligenerans cantabricum]